MHKLLKKNLDLDQLNTLANDIAAISNSGDLLLLNGELGTGKTSFSRFFINSIYEKNSLKKPEIIRSPSFPILITYEIKNFEIFHYDFYRLNNEKDLKELNIFENLQKNITIIEWPAIILKYYKNINYYLLNFKIINSRKRELEIFHTKKTKFKNVF